LFSFPSGISGSVGTGDYKLVALQLGSLFPVVVTVIAMRGATAGATGMIKHVGGVDTVFNGRQRFARL